MLGAQCISRSAQRLAPRGLDLLVRAMCSGVVHLHALNWIHAAWRQDDAPDWDLLPAHA